MLGPQAHIQHAPATAHAALLNQHRKFEHITRKAKLVIYLVPYTPLVPEGVTNRSPAHTIPSTV